MKRQLTFGLVEVLDILMYRQTKRIIPFIIPTHHPIRPKKNIFLRWVLKKSAKYFHYFF